MVSWYLPCIPVLLISLDSLRSILPKVLYKRGLHAAAQASLLTYAAQRWLEECLPHLRRDIRVSQYKDAVLTVSCRHGIALQECRHALPMLRETLSREYPQALLEEIRLVRTGR